MKSLKLIICLMFLSAANWMNAQWLQQPFPSTEDLYKVRFVNSNAGWVLGENAIYKTADGGKTWAKQDSPTKFGNLLLALSGLDAAIARLCCPTAFTFIVCMPAPMWF